MEKYKLPYIQNKHFSKQEEKAKRIVMGSMLS